MTPDEKARAEFQLLYRLAEDPLFQAALGRYADGKGSSHGVAMALLTAGRYWTVRTALDAAAHALRSYQYDNASPDLAGSIASLCEAALVLPAPVDPAPADLLRTLSELTEVARRLVPAPAAGGPA